jgi:hypothetical protein
MVDANPRFRLSVTTLELPDGTVFDQYVVRGADRIGAPLADEAEEVRWIPLAELPGLIATGQITGAATIIGAQHALLTAGEHAR